MGRELTHVPQRDEFRQSLLIDKPSRLCVTTFLHLLFAILLLTVATYRSPASHARIYPHSDYSLTLFAIPDEIYAPFFFDPDPVRRTTPFIEYGQCIDGLEHYLHRLNAILLYAPLAFLLRSVDRCWAALDAFASFIDGEIARVLDDSRIENLSPSVRANRPAKFAFNLWACRLFALPTLHGCHAAVLRLDATDRVKRKSVDRIYVELNALARLAKRVMVRSFVTPVSLVRSTDEENLLAERVYFYPGAQLFHRLPPRRRTRAPQAIPTRLGVQQHRRARPVRYRA